MQIIIIDKDPRTKATLIGQVQEGVRQAEMRRMDVVALDIESISEVDVPSVAGILIGPGYYDNLDEVVESVRGVMPAALLAVALRVDVYQSESMTLRKTKRLHVLSVDDIVQIGSFVLDCENSQAALAPAAKNKGVIAVTQLKGGVGGSTLAAAFASCWARHNLNVALFDLDDVNPHLTSWGRVNMQQQSVVGELLRHGEVPVERVNEILQPVEGYDGKLVVVGQPERYNEGFHFKADVLEGVPSAAEFVTSLLDTLRSEFDVVVIDTGRSWGVSTFTLLPLCQAVLLVTDDDAISIRMTLDALERLKRESDDSSEFDFSRWSFVMNAYTGSNVQPKELAAEIREMDLLPPDCTLYTVPYSLKGRLWGSPGQSFFDVCDEPVRGVIRKICQAIVPFKYEATKQGVSQLIKKWGALVEGRK